MGFLLQGVLQSLARLEHDALGSSDGDGLAGAGVDALTLSALTHLEGAEAGDGDLLTLGHSLAIFASDLLQKVKKEENSKARKV